VGWGGAPIDAVARVVNFHKQPGAGRMEQLLYTTGLLKALEELP
jgi:hypothetical protein